MIRKALNDVLADTQALKKSNEKTMIVATDEEKEVQEVKDLIIKLDKALADRDSEKTMFKNLLGRRLTASNSFLEALTTSA